VSQNLGVNQDAGACQVFSGRQMMSAGHGRNGHQVGSACQGCGGYQANCAGHGICEDCAGHGICEGHIARAVVREAGARERVRANRAVGTSCCVRASCPVGPISEARAR